MNISGQRSGLAANVKHKMLRWLEISCLRQRRRLRQKPKLRTSLSDFNMMPIFGVQFWNELLCGFGDALRSVRLHSSQKPTITCLGLTSDSDSAKKMVDKWPNGFKYWISTGCFRYTRPHHDKKRQEQPYHIASAVPGRVGPMGRHAASCIASGVGAPSLLWESMQSWRSFIVKR